LQRLDIKRKKTARRVIELGLKAKKWAPMAGNPPWAPEEDQRLQALALSGVSVAEMAKQMKRSEEAVRSRAYRLKILVAKSRKLRLKAKGK
jgi:hypothetical protein